MAQGVAATTAKRNAMNHSNNCHSTEAGRLMIASTGHGASQTCIAAEDWDLLFYAVTERLGQCASHLLAAGSVPQPTASAMTFSSEVTECVDALAQLHADLRQHRNCIHE